MSKTRPSTELHSRIHESRRYQGQLDIGLDTTEKPTLRDRQEPRTPRTDSACAGARQHGRVPDWTGAAEPTKGAKGHRRSAVSPSLAPTANFFRARPR